MGGQGFPSPIHTPCLYTNTRTQKNTSKTLVFPLFDLCVTDGRMDGRTDGRMSGNSPLCPTGHWPFGAAAQKASKTLVFPLFDSCVTDGRTDGRTNGWTGKAFYRVACPQLEMWR